MKKRLLFIVICIFILASAVAAERPAPPPAGMVCPTGHTCHLLLEEGSQVFILTANGRMRVDIFGHDVGLVSNRPNNEAIE